MSDSLVSIPPATAALAGQHRPPRTLAAGSSAAYQTLDCLTELGRNASRAARNEDDVALCSLIGAGQCWLMHTRQGGRSQSVLAFSEQTPRRPGASLHVWPSFTQVAAGASLAEEGQPARTASAAAKSHRGRRTTPGENGKHRNTGREPRTNASLPYERRGRALTRAAVSEVSEFGPLTCVRARHPYPWGLLFTFPTKGGDRLRRGPRNLYCVSEGPPDLANPGMENTSANDNALALAA
jgi:hypothetical protein